MSDNLVDIIIKEFNEIDLATLYSWNIPKRDDLELISGNSNFDKNVNLKKYLHEIMQKQSKEDYLETAYWIIKKWGGISSFKKNDLNDQRLLDLKNKINENVDIDIVFKDKYDSIASYSKVAAFYKPDTFAVFDARVTFTLRWFIYSYKLDTMYFRQLPSRNTKIKNCISKLQNKIPLAENKEKYYPKNEEYAEYCKLLKNVAGKMGNQIYEVEMFLFSIAAPQRNKAMCDAKYITNRIIAS